MDLQKQALPSPKYFSMHLQEKLPSVLVHLARPTIQSSVPIAHSSTSDTKVENKVVFRYRHLPKSWPLSLKFHGSLAKKDQYTAFKPNLQFL